MTAKRELMEREVERLKGETGILARDWRRIPFLVATVLFAIPAFYIWGPLAALFVILLTPCLVITALYLIGVRKVENRQAIEELERQLQAPDKK